LHLFELFTPQQWILGLITAAAVGFSKTGLPGAGVLVVPLMAQAFGARLSIGTTVVILIMGDVFAVLWYRQHAQLDKIWKLAPWVVFGMVSGGLALWLIGEKQGRGIMSPIIGWLVLAMIVVTVLRKRLGPKFAPHSPMGIRLTGGIAGFSTTVANAAGPVMAIYLQSVGLLKDQLMGTNAWYFFIFNVAKIPLYIGLTLIGPNAPVWTVHTLEFTLIAFPLVVLGAYLGKWALPRIDQRTFDILVLVVAAVAAVKLIVA
jgi:uncharacterized membrane protein YfcA